MGMLYAAMIERLAVDKYCSKSHRPEIKMLIFAGIRVQKLSRKGAHQGEWTPVPGD